MDIAMKADVATGKVKIMVERNQALSDMNKVPRINVASSSKKVTYVFQYVPKAKKVESQSSELQHNVVGGLTFPIKRIDAIKSSPKEVISGDDDLPKRDDIGERRRKHEMRVLAGAGVEPFDDVKDEHGDHASDDVAATSDDGEMDSDLEYYREVEKQHSAKVAAKEKMYSRSLAPLLAPETLVDGKRQINYQMEKNRGLTRNRKKQDKNPRKKYRGKHEKAQKRREGQVQKVKKPSGPYGGETTGINAGTSRSIRFKGLDKYLFNIGHQRDLENSPKYESKKIKDLS
ncbi:hypothetical protein RND71_020980 [Anisodus tanguticus]|uniref:Sas10 C-terminal domain-containing protein n=1 Tax=Anisodus tanguticus TaxID=243964 RepID=A0AAE1VCE6_9SOLA|nr:hypothetical protein RND71_020980 [Anisodus tanguticus]